MVAKARIKKIGLIVLSLVIVVAVVIAVLVVNLARNEQTQEAVVDTGQSGENLETEDWNDSTTVEVATEAVPTTEQKIQDLLAKMTVEEKVGQMFVARCPAAEAVEKAAEYHLGGYILFGQDFAGKGREEIVQTIGSYQSAASIPLFIAVDEEGGIVNRVSTNPNLRAVPFWAPQDLYQAGGFDLVRSDTKEKADLLKSLGINVNFAPVADVSTDPNDFIYARSFGQNAAATAEYVKNVIEVMKEQKIGSVLKHFPGYGNNVDTHTGVAEDGRDYATFVNSDFVPFQAGIEAGANVVLVAHNVVASIDAAMPASLSARAHQILREDLGFTGAIITDDLVMEGVRQFGTDEQTAVMAVQAGNDLLCSTDFETQMPAVVEAVNNGEISEERINESVERILEMKVELGMLQV